MNVLTDAEKPITLEHREAIRAALIRYYSGQCTLTQALHEDPRIGKGTYYAYRKQLPDEIAAIDREARRAAEHPVSSAAEDAASRPG